MLFAFDCLTYVAIFAEIMRQTNELLVFIVVLELIFEFGRKTEREEAVWNEGSNGSK